MKAQALVARSSRFQSGFTLLEIMLVVVIIGIIVTFALVNLIGTTDQAKIDLARAYVKGTLKTQIGLFQLHNSSYPTSLNDLLVKPSDATNWRGPYMDELPKDPFGEDYQYQSPGTHNPNSYDVWSKGPDKQSGTADDIGNWAATTTASQ